MINVVYMDLKIYKNRLTQGIVPTTKFYFKQRRFFKKLSISPEIRGEWEKELLTVKETMPNKLPYPDCFAVSKSNALFLYNYIRVNKPDIVVETGVANGFSSRFILKAMYENCKGKLYSVDIKNDVGVLVPDQYRSRWELVIGMPKDALTNLLKQLPVIDVFMHDSDHSEENMLFEFSLALPKVSNAIISDDVQCNEAFIIFAKQQGIEPLLYRSLRKAYGVLPLKK